MAGTNFGVLRTNADGNNERVYLTDESNNPLLVVGTTVPTSGTYAKGCIFIDSDVASGSKAVYENQGTTTSVSFNLIGGVAATEITLASANILVGSADGTARAQPLSGDGTLSSAGALTITTDAIDNTKLDFETATVALAASVKTGTAAITSGATIFGFYPTVNNDGAVVGSISAAGAVLTLAVASAMSAGATFVVTLVKP